LHLGNKDQKWIFINGICNTQGMTELNRLRLQQLFKQSVTVIHNPSQGAFLDLIECIFGRTFGIPSAPSASAFNEVVFFLSFVILYLMY